MEDLVKLQELRADELKMLAEVQNRQIQRLQHFIEVFS